MTTNAKPTATDAYVGAHIFAMTQLDEIRNLLQDLPAPDDDNKIHWGHVGNLGHVNELLCQVANFLACRNH